MPKLKFRRERVRAIAELKGEVVTLSMNATTKIIGNINEEISARVVNDFINKIDEENRWFTMLSNDLANKYAKALFLN